MATILIVDDQQMSRQFLATLLGYFEHEVLEAQDGIEGLESLRSGRVDLIIADVLMPTMDGHEFLQRMRSDVTLAYTPVIFYSAAHYESDARAMAEARGVRHFLRKPAEAEEILDAVNAALGHAPGLNASVGLTKFHRRLLLAPADPIEPDAVVFIIDDDELDRGSLSMAVAHAGLRVQTFATAEEFLEAYEPTHANCLVLDIVLPGMSGIQLLEVLRSRRLDIPAVILTAHADTAAAVEAMRFRVVDFLAKPADPRILLAKVFRVLQQDSIRRREQAETAAIRKRMSLLTAREKDLIKLLILGKTSKEIASELKISIKTVSNHRAHLMEKTRAQNLADLVRMSMIAHDL